MSASFRIEEWTDEDGNTRKKLRLYEDVPGESGYWQIKTVIAKTLNPQMQDDEGYVEELKKTMLIEQGME